MRRQGWVLVAVAALGGVAAVAIVLSGRESPPTPPGEFIVLPAYPIADSARFEPIQVQVSKRIADYFGSGIRGHDDARITQILTEDFLGRLPGADGEIETEEEGLRVVSLPCGDLPALEAGAFLQRLARHTAPLAKIDRCSFQCFEFLLDPSETRAVATFHWHLAGRRTDGRPIELQADAEMELVARDGTWWVRRFGLRKARRIESRRPPFVDVTAATGFDFAYSAEGRGLLQAVIDNRDSAAVVGGLSVVDWNRDNFPDVIATHGGRRSVLFVNDGHGGFVPEELPSQGAYFYLSLDLDGDGREELVSTQIHATGERTATLELFTRVHDAWELRPEALVFEKSASQRFMAFPHITAGDVDGDGDLDLFYSGYLHSESRGRLNLITGQNGLRNLLFINQGGLNFSEESERRGIRGTPWTYLSKFYDIDGDRNLDLLVINDYGPNNVYRNQGDGTFTNEPDHPFAVGTTFGMGLAISDYDNTGDDRVYMSYMYSHAGRRMVPLAPNLSPAHRSMLAFTARGNALYERSAGGWTERAAELGVHNAGWAWACIFFDADNDCDKDLFVVNGFTTNSNPDAPEF